MPINKNSKIYIAGHRGMVGSAIIRQLESRGYTNLITQTHKQLELTDQTSVKSFFVEQKPEYVVIAAAKVGGIHANNTQPAEFIYQNIMIAANLIHAAYQNNVKRLLFLGSTCIYPKMAKQPMREDALLTGLLEPTNEPYGVAKIAGIKLCESYNRQCGTDYRSVMPTNLYGIYDDFHPENSHVIPGLMLRFHQAKINKDNEVIVWGTGNAKREFLYVDDMAKASLFVLELDQNIYQANTKPMLSHINVGTGVDISIRETAEIIKLVVGFEGELKFDASKPDGPPRKCSDISLLTAMGWSPNVGLKEGLVKTYEWYKGYQRNN